MQFIISKIQLILKKIILTWLLLAIYFGISNAEGYMENNSNNHVQKKCTHLQKNVHFKLCFSKKLGENADCLTIISQTY